MQDNNSAKNEVRELIYAEYDREIRLLEQERDQIEKEKKVLEKDQDSFDEVHRGLRSVFREICKCCEADDFIFEIEECEDDIYDEYRKCENYLEEKKDALTEEWRKTYDKEEELELTMKRKLKDLDT